MGERRRDGEQHPVVRCAPVFLECCTLLRQQFALGGVVHHHQPAWWIDAVDYNIMQGGLTLGPKRDDEGAAFLQLSFEVAPVAAEREDLVAVLPEISLHG